MFPKRLRYQYYKAVLTQHTSDIEVIMNLKKDQFSSELQHLSDVELLLRKDQIEVELKHRSDQRIERLFQSFSHLSRQELASLKEKIADHLEQPRTIRNQPPVKVQKAIATAISDEVATAIPDEVATAISDEIEIAEEPASPEVTLSLVPPQPVALEPEVEANSEAEPGEPSFDPAELDSLFSQQIPPALEEIAAVMEEPMPLMPEAS